MTVNDIPNIEHCTVTPVGDPVIAYRVTTNNGWYIHLNNGVEETQNDYKNAVVLILPYDFSTVEIVAEENLPAFSEFWVDPEEDRKIQTIYIFG